MVDFVKPIANKDTNACQLLIAELKKNLPNELASWEQPLVSLVTGIEHHYDHDTLLSILEELPTEITEAVFTKLLVPGNHHATYVYTLVTYINNLPPDEKTHQVNLINKILCAPVPLTIHSETQELLFKLNAKEQGTLLTRLNQQADNCLVQNNGKEIHPYQKKLNQIYNTNCQQLILFLTIHVSKTETTLQIALNEDPTLSNLLICQLLRADLSEIKQKKHILNLFKDNKNYDWNDPVFNQVIRSKLITLFPALSAQELKDFFNHYVTMSYQQHHSVINIIQFLDDLYANTNDISLITHCLEAVDNEDYAFTINFLTHSQTRDRALRQQCLKKININQLAKFCGLIIALGQMGQDPEHELFADYISIFCEHLKTQPSPQELFSQLVSHIAFLPINEEQLAITTITNKLSLVNQKSLWLQTLIQSYTNTTCLLPHCAQFIQEHPEKIELILPFINHLSHDDLLNLYLLMITKGFQKTAFHCFRELFKDREKHHHLFYILSNTPIINHELLNEFIASLDDKSLITLIDQLLTKATPNSEFKTTINQVLLIFCQRLYAAQSPDMPIHQWIKQPYAEDLVHHLLSNPECVSQLTTTYSTLYSLVTWSNIALAFHYRMDTVLNCVELKQDKINQIVLIWLDYFRPHPEQLYNLFYNLHYSESNRNAIGKQNLLGIKQACWKLINPDAIYKENDFLNLLYYAKQNVFASASQLLTQEEYLHKDPHLASLWLARTSSSLPKEINEKIVMPLLTHSVDEKTLGNWKKILVWLELQETDHQLTFAKKLIDTVCDSRNNPVLGKQAYQFITQYQSFNSLLPKLEPDHWYWLIKEASPAERIQKTSSWVDLIIQKHNANSVNLGKLLSLLPQDTSLIDSLLKKAAFAAPETFAQIFAQLSVETDCAIQFACIHRFIIEQDETWKNQFLRMTINQIKTRNINTSGIQILNSLINNNVHGFSSLHQEDKNLIIKYLKFLNSLNQDDTNKQSIETKQLIFNFLINLFNHDPHWNQVIYGDEAFTQTALIWIHNTDFSSLEQAINDHPLTKLFIEAQTINLNLKLKKDPLFQKWLSTLLSHPPQKLQKNQFQLLFDLLLTENKVLLAQQILADTQLSETYIQAIDILANVLNPIDLFELFEGKINPGPIAKGLFAHHKGLKELSQIQRIKLFDNIDSSAYLLNLLVNQSSVDARIIFVKELFHIYGQDPKNLSQKLGLWHINSETLAALANFTIDEKDQYILDDVLKEKSYYRDFLNDYLHRPTLEMPLNKDSFLYRLARHNMLNTATKKPCKAEFIQQLPKEDALTVIKKQLDVNQDIQILNSLFSPFKTGAHNVTNLLHSALWQHQLILIYGGLLEVFRFYQDKETPQPTKQIIEQTKLYHEFMLPLLNKASKENLDGISSNRLFNALLQYSKAVFHLDINHHKSLNNILSRYTAQVNAIKNFSAPRLFNFFNNNSPIDPLNQQESLTLTDEETAILLNAAALHKTWLVRYELEPEKQFSEVLNVGLQELQLKHGNGKDSWFFQIALFSSLSCQLDETILKNYVTSINPAELSVLTHNFFEKIQSCQHTLAMLQDIKPIEPAIEFVKQLATKDLTVLNQSKTAASSLNLFHLNDLISLAISIKNLNLDEKQISVLFLSKEFSGNQEMNWLQTDLQLMQERIAHATERWEQITVLGFSHHGDGQNTSRIRFLTHKKLEHIPMNMLLKCLNSYAPVFTHPEESNIFLKFFDKMLSLPQMTKELFAGLNENLINQTIAAAIKAPAHYSDLLEKIINSNWSELCLQQLQIALNRLINQNEDLQLTNISQLCAEQIENLPSEVLTKILAIQRLIFFGKPAADLNSFANIPGMEATSRDRQLFCADASLFMALINLQKASPHPMNHSTSWLAQHSKANFKTYAASIEACNPGKEINYPTVHCYWLCWKAFISVVLYKNNNILIDGLLHWLSKLNETELKNAPDLINLLKWVITQQLISKTFSRILEHRAILKTAQITWLCEQSLLIAPEDLSLYPLIINLNSWSWLDNYMKNGSSLNFDLLKVALGNKKYLSDINENETKQTEFLNVLKTNKFTYSQILELIHSAGNDQIRSLLIIYILSQQEYLTGFKGESVLTRLTNNETPPPSRLNALIYQLDIKMITLPVIAKLPPETVVSILCSFPHFHLLKEEQIGALLKQYPKQEVITYWMKHYSSMPNAHFTLVHLMKLAEFHVFAEIKKMDDIKREALISNMIRHLELFDPANKILQERNEENRLILAIRLFLNGHQHHSYVTYINMLADKLLLNKHQFSLEAMQLIISLNDKEEFSGLTNKTVHLTNHYLRAKAQIGEVELFYHAGRMDGRSMTQHIPLIQASNSTIKNFFARLLGSKPDAGTIIPEHELIEKIAQCRKQITAFDYFLIHFKGDISKISNAIDDYLGFYAREGDATNKRKSVHQICELMNRAEIEPPIKEAIYNSFLRHPSLYDKHICFNLFIFNAKRTIQYFGMKGGEKNYTQVIELCNLALKKLDPGQHKEIIKMTKTAQAEAELELTCHEERGFFANLFRRLKRCWISGWTGFFNPNPPLYVLPAANTAQNANSSTDMEPHILPYKPEPSLPDRLKELVLPLTQENLDKLVDAINFFSLKATPQNEIETRHKLHILILQLIQESKENKNIEAWLMKNQMLFSTNSFQLLQLTLINGPRKVIDTVIKQINETSYLQNLMVELNCSLPEQQENNTITSLISPEIVETTIKTVSNAKQIAYNAWSWTRGELETFFKPENAISMPEEPEQPNCSLTKVQI